MAAQVSKIERRTDLTGKTLYLIIKSGSRSRQHKFFEPHEVPDFEGDSAWFEIEPRSGRAHWKVLRQVAPPAGPIAKNDCPPSSATGGSGTGDGRR